MNTRQVFLPTLVRVKPGALDRLGLYAERQGFARVAVLHSADLAAPLMQRLHAALAGRTLMVSPIIPVTDASFESAAAIFATLPAGLEAVIGCGGGKALDVAKYVAFLAKLPYLAVPTSLSNDGFCSPQSSLTMSGKRRSLPSRMPFGIVVDTGICHQAPLPLWWSGVGDLVSKFTAVRDWKLAFHACGTPVDDLAALLSDATVFQFIARPERDPAGIKLLASALLLNGIAMEMCGSSRPASGSEHLISHALDAGSKRPRLHGLQVGVATYLVSHLQGGDHEVVGGLLDRVGFWDAFAQEPLDRNEWLAAAQRAPAIKAGFHTILAERDCLPEITRLLAEDPRLRRVFIG